MQDHARIVQDIEKRMAGASMNKSQEQKKQQIFEYGETGQKFDDPLPENQSIYQTSISTGVAEKSLEEIYNYYVNSYIQTRIHLDTFDSVNERKLTFQPFILFMKNFRILKVIFPLDKIKLFFKKYSNFGQYLTSENFFFLINELSHENEAKQFFNIEEIQQKFSLDVESIEELEKQQFYSYLCLGSPEKYRLNFRNVFQPFLNKTKVETKKINFTYRKFSQPQLLKKSLKPVKDQTQEKELQVVKNKEVQADRIDDNPFNQVKSIVVSWESLRSKSVASIQKNSTDIVKRKYVRDEAEDDEYLREYESKRKQDKKRLDKKIDEIAKEQQKKDKMVLARLSEKAGGKSLLLKRANKK